MYEHIYVDVFKAGGQTDPLWWVHAPIAVDGALETDDGVGVHADESNGTVHTMEGDGEEDGAALEAPDTELAVPEDDPAAAELGADHAGCARAVREASVPRHASVQVNRKLVF